MRTTANETSETTLARLITAADRQHPVTITYLKEAKDDAGKTITEEKDGKKVAKLVETIRTIEIYDVTTTKAGAIVVKAMDRGTGESRSWRLDRIRSYTVHRTSYTVARPAASEARPAVAPSLRRAEDALAGLPRIPLSDPVRDAEWRVELLADRLAAA